MTTGRTKIPCENGAIPSPTYCKTCLHLPEEIFPLGLENCSAKANLNAGRHLFRSDCAMRKEAVRTGPAPLNLPFSPGIKYGDLIFVSGQGPIDQNGKVIPGDVRSQTKTTLKTFEECSEQLDPTSTTYYRQRSISATLTIFPA